MTRLCRSIALAFALVAFAPAIPAEAAERIALVIGNSSYRPGYELRNSVADARAIADRLSSLGFDVMLVSDTDLATAQRALDALVDKGFSADAALIFYAGNGAMIGACSFMMQVDLSMSLF